MKARVVYLVLCIFLALSPVASIFGRDNPVVLKAGHIFPTGHVTHKALLMFSEAVEKNSNGSLKIEIFPLGQLGTGASLSQNIMLGTVDMGTAGPGLLSGIEPAFGIWSAEYLFKDADSLFRVVNSPVGKEIFDRLEKKGIKTLGVGYLGQRHLTTNNKPVYKASDLRGLKIRIPEIAYRRAAFTALGASPTPMAMSEMYLALQQGVVDGQENPLPQIFSAKLYEVQKYLMLTGHAQNPEMLIINRRKFEGLGKAQQDALVKSAPAFAKTSRELVEAEEADLLNKLKTAGMIVIEPDTDSFREATKDVPARFTKTWGEGLYEKVLEAQK